MTKKKKEVKEKSGCKHKFNFSHWESFTNPDNVIYVSRAVIICEKCGELRIKKAYD